MLLLSLLCVKQFHSPISNTRIEDKNISTFGELTLIYMHIADIVNGVGRFLKHLRNIRGLILVDTVPWMM